MSPEVVAVREASTVILIRDSEDGVQAWLLRRVPRMAFAAGMTVFPGGAVDPVDSVPGAAESAEQLQAVAAQLATTAEHAGRLLRAALRETLEETDIALAMADLHPWARWITPASERVNRRYDTYFFVARCPSDQTARSVTSEASGAAWTLASTAVAESAAGALALLPPTLANLTEVAALGTVDEVIRAAAGRTIAPIEPVFTRDETGRWFVDIGGGTLLALPPDFGVQA